MELGGGFKIENYEIYEAIRSPVYLLLGAIYLWKFSQLLWLATHENNMLITFLVIGFFPAVFAYIFIYTVVKRLWNGRVVSE